MRRIRINREALIEIIDNIVTETESIKKKLDNLNNHTLKQEIEMLGNRINFRLIALEGN